MKVNYYMRGCYLLIVCVFVLAIWGSSIDVLAAEKTSTTIEEVMPEIDILIEKISKKIEIPGMSIAIINDNEVSFLNYGYADKEGLISVNNETLFEIGSMSKAFTAIALYLLESQGRLSLNDDITTYIPWLKLQFDGECDGLQYNGEVSLKISNFLHHSSGIPFQSIGYIPEGDTSDMLEKTVRTLVGTQLDFYPGTKYQYATINYDVLALVIETVSGQSYEEYMYEYVLEPMGLTSTYTSKEDITTNILAQGHKMQFFSAKPYDAPVYKGNTAAGHILSNSTDLVRWMQLQMGLTEIETKYSQLIEKTHIGDTTVASRSDYFYGAGWNIQLRGESINHGGTNPNYSSMMVMKPDNKLGVCVLTNINSNAASYLADNIINLIENKRVDTYEYDEYYESDFIFSVITICSCAVLPILFFLLIKAVVEIRQNKRRYEKLHRVKVASIGLAIPLIGFLGFCIYYLPNIIMRRLPWSAVTVWCSANIRSGCIMGYSVFVLFMVYTLITFNYTKENEKGYIALIPLSVVNGLSSALIIFTINESFNRNLEYSNELLIYFLFSISFFVYTLKLVQGRTIVIANEYVYQKRMQIIDKLLTSPYQTVERIGHKKIFSALNNDTKIVSEIPGTIVRFASDLLTLLFCLFYLSTKSTYAFSLSLLTILLNGGLSVLTGKMASKYLEQNRDVQDTYFGQMNDLIYGFKEIVLNSKRKFDFSNELRDFSKKSVMLNKAAAIKFLNFDMYNSLMYNLVFGVIVFGLPILVGGIDVQNLRENLFIVFYMIGPFKGVTYAISRFAELQVSIGRINLLNSELENKQDLLMQESVAKDNNYNENELILKEVIFAYQTADEVGMSRDFVLGPINASFRSGQITFIVGGNGSGKSTLAKLIAGLYRPDSGQLCINGEDMKEYEVSEWFSAIFTDFHLFDKLYGYRNQEAREKLNEHLIKMEIADKIKLGENGEITSSELSSGQKKRLALAISFLENKPMLIFDEWAAEQDPAFRRYFYEDILPELRRQGKLVVVITHDDRYFKIADQVLKLDYGTLANP